MLQAEPMTSRTANACRLQQAGFNSVGGIPVFEILEG